MAKITRDQRALDLAKYINENYDIKNAEDLDLVMRQLYASTVEGFINTEFDEHMGYKNNSKEEKGTANRRNGKRTPKKVVTSVGEEQISMPRDLDGSFDSALLPKREKDLTKMESLILSLYAKGQSTRDISDTIEEIYDYRISHSLVARITDTAMSMIDEWLNRPLQRCYIFAFVDCIYVPVKDGNIHNNMAFYSIIGIGVDGRKDVLGFWASENESAHHWMNIFDEIKRHGVEELFFVSMDGLSGLKEGLQSIYPNAIVQRCIVRLIRNSMKYVASKDYVSFTKDLKAVYSAMNVNVSKRTFESFKEKWAKYPGAIRVWETNFIYVEQLFEFPSDIRRIIYTTNQIESFYSHLRKVTRNKSIFPNVTSVLKIFVLRTQELLSKWTRPKHNWHLVLNQLQTIERFDIRLKKFL